MQTQSVGELTVQKTNGGVQPQVKIPEFVDHYVEILTPTMLKAFNALGLNTRETRELVDSAIRNHLRSKLQSEFNKLKIKLADRNRQWITDKMSGEQIQERFEVYNKDIIALERLHKELAS